MIEHFKKTLPIDSEIPMMSGLYAIYISEEFVIDTIKLKGMIYLGKSQRNLKKRLIETHINPNPNKLAINSTFRRTLGSVLKNKLNLKVIPRYSHKNVHSMNDLSSFQFSPESESKLSKWLKETSRVNFHVIEDLDLLKQTERQLIEHFKPILNIEFNTTAETTKLIKTLRKQCRDGLISMYK